MTLSRYHRNDYTAVLTTQSMSGRDVYASVAFLDCRTNNYFIEELYNLLLENPALQTVGD